MSTFVAQDVLQVLKYQVQNAS